MPAELCGVSARKHGLAAAWPRFRNPFRHPVAGKSQKGYPSADPCGVVGQIVIRRHSARARTRNTLHVVRRYRVGRDFALFALTSESCSFLVLVPKSGISESKTSTRLKRSVKIVIVSYEIVFFLRLIALHEFVNNFAKNRSRYRNTSP